MVGDSEEPVKNPLLYDQLRGWRINVIASKIHHFPVASPWNCWGPRLVLRATPHTELDLEAGMKCFLRQLPGEDVCLLPHVAPRGSETDDDNRNVTRYERKFGSLSL